MAPGLECQRAKLLQPPLPPILSLKKTPPCFQSLFSPFKQSCQVLAKRVYPNPVPTAVNTSSSSLKVALIIALKVGAIDATLAHKTPGIGYSI